MGIHVRGLLSRPAIDALVDQSGVQLVKVARSRGEYTEGVVVGVMHTGVHCHVMVRPTI